jgi:hypothetical protein
MSDDKHQILKGIGKGLGQLGVETVEKAKEEGSKVLESVITGKQLLGLERTMSDSELEFRKHEDDQKKAEEIKKLKGEMGQGGEIKEEKRDVEKEMKELRDQKTKEEEEKEKYYEEQNRKREEERQRQEEQYNDLEMESTNPAKQKKSRGSAFIQGKKKKSQPTQSQMSQTQEFKGKID